MFFLLLLLPALSGGIAWLLDNQQENGTVFPFAQGDRLEAWTVQAGDDIPFAKILAGAGDFRPAGRDGHVETAPGEVLWVRLTLHNDRDEVVAGVLRQATSYHDEVDFFYREGAAWRQERGGLATGASSSSLPGDEIAFPVMLRMHETAVFYLRMDDPYGALCDLRWHTPAGYMRRSQVSSAVDGVYFGLLAGLLFYNAFFYLRARQEDLIWYCAYLVTFGCWVLVESNRTMSLRWALGSPLRDQIFMALLFAAVGFVARLTRRTLEPSRCLPAWDRRLVWVEIVAAVCAAGVFFTGRSLVFNDVFTPVLMSTHLLGVVVLVAAWRMWRRGVNTAAYFVLALASLLGAFGQGVVAQIVGSNAMDWRNFTVKIGSIQEMLIFGLAMAERVRGLHREREDAQARALVEARHNETLQASFAEELAREVNERAAELARLSAEKDQLMRLLGHDLRSPLASLDAGLVEMSRDPFGKSSEALVQRLRVQARHVNALVQDILTRINDDLPLQADTPVSLDLADFTESVVTLCRPQAERKGQALVLETVDPVTVMIVGSVPLLRQALVNLVENAIKFTPKDKQIRVGARLESGWLSVEVTDEGPGLQPQDMAGLFQKSRPLSAQPTGGESSTGLGLYLVHEIIRRHGGKMKVASVPGQGAVFGFTLPVVKPA